MDEAFSDFISAENRLSVNFGGFEGRVVECSFKEIKVLNPRF
jgi:hypothetical protein